VKTFYRGGPKDRTREQRAQRCQSHKRDHAVAFEQAFECRRFNHRGIRSKPRPLSNGRLIGGGPFGVGALAYLLKNRFYIGEVVYRGEVQ